VAHDDASRSAGWNLDVAGNEPAVALHLIGPEGIDVTGLIVHLTPRGDGDTELVLIVRARYPYRGVPDPAMVGDRHTAIQPAIRAALYVVLDPLVDKRVQLAIGYVLIEDSQVVAAVRAQ